VKFQENVARALCAGQRLVDFYSIFKHIGDWAMVWIGARIISSRKQPNSSPVYPKINLFTSLKRLELKYVTSFVVWHAFIGGW